MNVMFRCLEHKSFGGKKDDIQVPLLETMLLFFRFVHSLGFLGSSNIPVFIMHIKLLLIFFSSLVLFYPDYGKLSCSNSPFEVITFRFSLHRINFYFYAIDNFKSLNPGRPAYGVYSVYLLWCKINGLSSKCSKQT